MLPFVRQRAWKNPACTNSATEYFRRRCMCHREESCPVLCQEKICFHIKGGYAWLAVGNFAFFLPLGLVCPLPTAEGDVGQHIFCPSTVMLQQARLHCLRCLNRLSNTTASDSCTLPQGDIHLRSVLATLHCLPLSCFVYLQPGLEELQPCRHSVPVSTRSQCDCMGHIGFLPALCIRKLHMFVDPSLSTLTDINS